MPSTDAIHTDPAVVFQASPRIAHLDGLRGAAILLVVGYHAFARWPEHLEHVQSTGSLLLFEHGWLGVQLFFMISGFVIFMSLDQSQSFGRFLWKRWLRLFPAMAIATLLILASAPWLTARPAGAPDLTSALPGLSMIEPRLWTKALGQPVGLLEGSFWSIFVEVKFYCIAAAVFFVFGRAALIPALVGLAVLGGLDALLDRFDVAWAAPAALNRISQLLSLEHFGWFAAGACFYRFSQTRQVAWLALAIVVAGAQTLLVVQEPRALLLAVLLVLAFSLCMVSDAVQKLLGLRSLVFMGFISYPLYLVHENMMVSLMRQHQYGALGVWIVPISLGVVGLLAWAIVRVGEPWLRGRLVHLAQWLANGSRRWERSRPRP